MVERGVGRGFFSFIAKGRYTDSRQYQHLSPSQKCITIAAPFLLIQVNLTFLRSLAEFVKTFNSSRVLGFTLFNRQLALSILHLNPKKVIEYHPVFRTNLVNPNRPIVRGKTVHLTVMHT